MFTRTLLLPPLVSLTRKLVSLNIFKKISLLLTMISITLKTGLLSTNALMSAWNLPLETEAKMNIVLVHPKYVKAIKGKKTDKKDSKWICDLFKHDLLKSSFIPSKDIRELRDLSRYRFKLICMRTSERNRYQNSMTVSNIALASVVSDPFGKTAKAIMNEVLSTEAIDEAKITKLIHGSCRNKDKIIESLKNSKIEPDQRFKMTEIQSHMNELDKHIEAVEIEIIKRASRYFDDFIHITEIDGIQLMSAILIISEIGVDMTQFETDKQLCCWAGVSPANNESAGKKRSVRISKAGQYLKPVLVQCALAAIRKKNSYFGQKYTRIKKRRGHKKAIIADACQYLSHDSYWRKVQSFRLRII